MKPLQVRGYLLLNGETQASLSRKLDCSEAMIHRVIRGQSKSRRIKAAINKIIGKPPGRSCAAKK